MITGYRFAQCECHGLDEECPRCEGYGIAEVPVLADDPKRHALLRKMFFLMIWLTFVFMAAWEFFGWVNR